MVNMPATPAVRHTGAMSFHASPLHTRLLRRGLMAAVFNTALAGVLATFGHDSFLINLMYAQLIGLTIWLLIDSGRFYLRPKHWGQPAPMAILVLVASLIGFLGGSAVGDMLRGYAPLHGMTLFPKSMTGFLLMSLTAGYGGTFLIMTREKLNRERLEREEAQRQASESQLKLLQSQLEPHMLFNTLANLRVLIGTDPQRATQMLDSLNNYLRSTLSASRATLHPLSAEFERLKDYLELMQIRMGPRLAYTLSLPPELAAQPVPPLLLQPLVENAIKHGLEPRVEGGAVTVTASAAHGVLTLEVHDTGGGLQTAEHHATRAPLNLRHAADAAHSADAENAATIETTKGFGLAQVRERLQSAYGDAGALNFIAAHARITRVVVTIPLKIGV
jgi:hypothetical protein